MKKFRLKVKNGPKILSKVIATELTNQIQGLASNDVTAMRQCYVIVLMTSSASKRPNMRIPLNFAQLSFEISYVMGIGKTLFDLI